MIKLSAIIVSLFVHAEFYKHDRSTYTNLSLTLFQLVSPVIAYGGILHMQGRFEIISLSGSLLRSESNSGRTSSLSVSLAGSDGRVLGGGVAGLLTAATPVQVLF